MPSHCPPKGTFQSLLTNFVTNLAFLVALVIGLAITIGFAFTPISFVGEAIALAALLVLAVRGFARVARSLRQHHSSASRFP
jgi:hypothetical protein